MNIMTAPKVRGPWLIADMDSVIENSYRDFHAKGFDYLCLRRSEEMTIKAYFFDGDVTKLPEVINPHDHRYDFMTNCLSGEVRNKTFIRTRYSNRPSAQNFQRFAYRTPLNGGNGFTWEAEECLLQLDDRWFGQDSKFGTNYVMRAEEIHTIQITRPGTILLLFQHRDIAALGQPTFTWTIDEKPPSLSGLYSRMTADHVRGRLQQLNDCASYFNVGLAS